MKQVQQVRLQACSVYGKLGVKKCEQQNVILEELSYDQNSSLHNKAHVTYLQ